MGASSIPTPSFVFGCSWARRAAIVLTCPCACARGTPGASRPTARKMPRLPFWTSPGPLAPEASIAPPSPPPSAPQAVGLGAPRGGLGEQGGGPTRGGEGGGRPARRDQALRLRVGQGTQQHSADEAEHRGVRAHAQRERGHGHGGEAGGLAELAGGGAEGLRARGPPRSAPGRAGGTPPR